MKRTIPVTERDAGMRLDKFLAGIFFELSREDIIRAIKEGHVSMNGKLSKPSARVHPTDIISADITGSSRALIPNSSLSVEVLYEDGDCIVFNKPVGLSVHPAARPCGNSLVEVALARIPEVRSVGDGSPGSDLRPGIVHRLDKDTSGVVVIAKNQLVFDCLKQQFKARSVKKTYLAIVHGVPKHRSETISKPIARSASYRKQVVATRSTKPKRREAITTFTLLDHNQSHSLLEVIPHTGRTHQIRVHMASIGNPLLGDRLYGGNKADFADLAHHVLHAFSISFTLNDSNITVFAPIPDVFRRYFPAIDDLVKARYDR